VAIGVAALGLIALAEPSRANAAVTCTYSGDPFNVATIRLGEPGDRADVEVVGAEIQVRGGTVPCPGAGGPPTVDNTDTILINDTSDDPATPVAADGGTGIEIGRPSTFAPGATQERGSPAFSEIEIRVNSGLGSDLLRLEADPVAVVTDAISIGADGIDWNASAADPAPDSDVTHTGIDELVFVGGPGDDIVSAQGGDGTGDEFDGPARLTMFGLSGEDELTGGLGGDRLQGGDRADTLHGDGGDDSLAGGLGNDGLSGGDGANDIADYSEDGDVTVDLRQTGPQETGAGFDTLIDVENLRGSDGSDTLIGDAGVNFLSGREGDDTLDGGPGGDRLDGGCVSCEADTVTYERAPAGVTADLATGDAFGGGGSDDLHSVENVVGSPFADVLTGTAEDNVITGLGGADTISALGESDTVDARDGEPDTVSCGSENDKALADRQSVEGRIDGDCETVDFLAELTIPPGGIPPGGVGPGDAGVDVVLRGARSQRVVKQKGVIVEVLCPLEDCTASASGGGTASGKLALRPVTRSIRRGAPQRLKLRLGRRPLRALEEALDAGRRPKLTVTVRATDAAGNVAERGLVVKAKP
jgi:Ca2+-binding RTX toxin-like protein